MDIYVSPSDSIVRVFCNGELKGEIAVGHLTSETDLQQEVHLARHYRVQHYLVGRIICRIAQGGSGIQQYKAGLLSGLAKESQQHPLPGVPDIAPSNDRHFHQGWEDGMNLTAIHREATVNVSDELRTRGE